MSDFQFNRQRSEMPAGNGRFTRQAKVEGSSYSDLMTWCYLVPDGSRLVLRAAATTGYEGDDLSEAASACEKANLSVAWIEQKFRRK